MCLYLFIITIIITSIDYSYQGSAPKLKPFLFERNVATGQSVRVYCRLLEGSPPVSFRWLKDGHQLKPMTLESMGVVIESREDYSSLVIDRVSAITSGIYTCLVSNIYGSDTYSDVLVVEVPPYLRSSVLIPILVAIVIIVMACSGAYVYIKMEERNAQLAKAGILSVSPSKQFHYIDTSATPHMSHRTSIVSEEGSLAFKYSDSSDKTKPLLARPGQPAVLWAHETIAEESDENSYASLPFQKQHMASFKCQPNGEPPQLPPPLPPDNRTLMYDTPPNTSGGGNVFCKVDVHHNDNSDSYDEFFKPHHV
ncbi:hemicentin-2-like [Oppia nitens]|uniref:hemicentin-2-like n=1 Tax=Oppia nitens TaxID=1686743 RepID=UPI0023DB6064|nr:hemicentin-2-like [Oppia nitens]